MPQKNTKIVCTLGPSSDSVSELTKLIQAGMNVARLNFSHGTYEHHKCIIKNIRKAEKKLKRRISILQDLQGPKIRTGKMPEDGINIRRSDEVILTMKDTVGRVDKGKTIIPVQYKKLIDDVKKDDIVLLDDGLIELRITKVKKPEIHCIVKYGGIVLSHKGLSVPSATITAATITKKDKEDLAFGLQQNVDYVALSFVKDAKDIEDLRKMIQKHGKDTKIIAKIERHEAVTNLEEIVKAADGLMVARGDLGINMPPEQVPIIQKRIIKLANLYAKPVITATQVLHSMVKSPVATRAEISDAANAIFDHTDAIMLSNETAVGKYPARATRTLTRVAETVECELRQHQELFQTNQHNILHDATCLNAAELAIDTKADHIVIYTEDGYTARHISKHRPYTNIIVITPNNKIAQELSLIWGLNTILVAKLNTKSTGNILSYLKKAKLVKKEEQIVILCNASKKEKLISTLKV